MTRQYGSAAALQSFNNTRQATGERTFRMSICYDYHLHSAFSADSGTPAVRMIEQAIALGLRGICFTEHLDLDCPAQGPDFTLDVPSYFETLYELQSRYRQKLDIRIGLEFGLQPNHTKTLHALASQWPFDFIIASLHFVEGQDPYYPAFFEGKCERDCYASYFEEELRNLQRYPISDYDTLGHMDYIVRYGPNRNRKYSYAAYADYIDPILHTLIEHGTCLELNTGGLKYGLGEPNPASDILRRYRELGGELITIGSDAHAPEHLSYDFVQAEAILKDCGFQYYTVFRQRVPHMIPV